MAAPALSSVRRRAAAAPRAPTRFGQQLPGGWIKAAVFGLSLVPVAALGWRGFHQDLGANPIEFITHSTGDWTLRFLVLTLAITPLRKLTGLSGLIRFRRMLGLFAFFYGVLHLLTYLWLDQFFDPSSIVKDIAKRPFITAGFSAFLCMVPLAITSTAGWIRRLGGKRWQRLHRLIYASAAAGVIHYYWLVKSDVRRPVFYGGLVGILLLYRVAASLRKRLPAGGAVRRPGGPAAIFERSRNPAAQAGEVPERREARC